MISDEDVIKNLPVFETTDSLSGELGVPNDLLRLKLAIMKTKGINLPFDTEFDYNIFKGM